MIRNYFIIFCFISTLAFSQRGKNGTVTISTANTIVNLYTPLIQNATAGTKTISVASSTSYSVGDLVFIIQMQGASVNAGKDSIFPDVNSAIPTNTTYGGITSYNNSGNNEYAQISAVPNSTTIVLDCDLQFSYDYIVHAQVIKVPRYYDLIISGGGSITCPNWNGSTGGVAVVEIQNNGTLSSTPSFSVTGKGFRGGATENISTAGGNKFGSLKAIEGAYKGESIAGDTTRYKVYSSVFARGAIANGGGGGCAHNAGGGGGANGGNTSTYDGSGNPVSGYTAAWNLEGGTFSAHTSSGGGRGGYSWSQANSNPSTTAPGSSSWNGDARRNVGGYGGRPLNYTTGKLFLGGGGGAGDGNNNQSGAGGNGGGMVYVVCYGNLSGAGTIIADGANGANSILGCSSNDGAGGGGGGGTIILNVNGLTSLTAATALSAKGGDGGNVNFNCILSNSEAYGPGASGGGGYLKVSGTLPSNNINGGANGIVTGNTGNISTSFPPNGATKGAIGSTGVITNYTLNASPNQTVCTSQSFTLTATSTQTSSTVSWYNAAFGGTAISTGTTYISSGYLVAGTYTVYAGVCPGTYRQPIIITVTSGLSMVVNSPTICAGQTTTLTVSGATTYTWSSGAITNSIVVNPTSTSIFTINGSSPTCSGTQTAIVNVIPNPTVSVSSVTICSGRTATLVASGASSYSWMPSGFTTSSIIVSPTVTTNYTVIGTIGICTNTSNVNVTVINTPTLSLASQTICAGQTATFNATGATTYTWVPGLTTGTIYTITPTTSTVITLIGANSSCTAQATASVTIGSSITISVNSPTICAGQSTTLTASGALSYTWNTGAITNSIVVNPSSTSVYTISASSGLCSGLNTSTVLVNPTPTLTVSNATICSGSQATLTVLGASSLTVSPTPLSITGSTIVYALLLSNTTYTITGSNGFCSSAFVGTINVIPNPTVSVNSSTICSGSTATLIATGASTYSWNTGALTNSILVTPISNTNYTVTGFNGICTSTIVASVVVHTVTVNNYSITVPICNQSAILFAGTSSATSYTWSNGVNTYSQTVTPSVTTSYSVTGTDSFGCLALNGVTTLSVINVIAGFDGINNQYILQGSNLNLTNTSSADAVTYEWDFCGGSSSNLIDQTYLALDTGYCCIKLIAMNGLCRDSVTKCFNIVSEPSIIAPNVFTPNNDGKNDVFKFKTIGIKKLECTIYDRWGLKLYEWDGVNGGWDGNTKNGVAPDGTYFYVLEYLDFSNKVSSSKGILQLFRK